MADAKKKDLIMRPVTAQVDGFKVVSLLNNKFLAEFVKEFPKGEIVRITYYIPGDEDKPGNYVYIGHESRDDFKNDVVTLDTSNPEQLPKVFKVINKLNKGD